MRNLTSAPSERTPAVVLGMGLPGLDIARSLGRRGIPVIGVDWRRTWASGSRYIRACAFPESRSSVALRDVVLRLGEGLHGRPLLLPLNDDFVLFVSRHRDELAPFYRFLMPAAWLIETLVPKYGLWTVCNGKGVALPATYRVPAGEDLIRLASDFPYPCIIKPNLSRDWVRWRPTIMSEGQKVIEVGSPAAVAQVSGHVAAAGCDVVVQEVIPGPDSNLYYLVVYFNERSEPLAAFVGRKLRMSPPHFGKGTYVESVHAPEIIRLGVELLRRLGYKGCGGVEFKLDPRDGVFKLIEINTRFGLWDGFPSRCGLDIAYMAYADAIGLPLPRHDTYRAGVRWVYLDSDLWAGLDYRRCGELSLLSWVRSLASCRAFAPGAWDDPAPFVAAKLELVRDAAAGMRRRLRR